MSPGLPGAPACATVLVALVLGPGAPAVAQTPAGAADLDIEFAQTPRLAQALPVTVRTTAPASYRAVAEIRVGSRRTGQDVVRGRAQSRGTLIRFRIPRSARTRALKEAARTRRPPVVVVTVTATLDGRPGTAVRALERRLRRAPFYDGRLRAPDAAREATSRFAITWDLPFEFTQVYGALEGTPAVGSFRKVVSAREGGPRCTLLLSGSATTARAAGRLSRDVRLRGTRGPWRSEVGAYDAVASRRAPARLPGSRPWLVARFHVETVGEGCRGERDRTVLASLRRAVRSVALRYAAPQLGPGFDIA